MKSPPFSQLKHRNSNLVRAIAVLLIFSFGYLIGSRSYSPQFNPQSYQFLSNCTSNHISKEPKSSQQIHEETDSSSSSPPHDLLTFKTRCTDPVPNSEILHTIFTKLFDGLDPYENFPSKEISSLIHKPKKDPRGWGSRGAVFRDLIESVRPDVIIELGAFLGASALHMAQISRNISLDSSLILSVDDFRGWPGFRSKIKRDVPQNRDGDSLLLQQFMANVQSAGESNRVIPIPFSTGSALIAFCEWGIYGDLIEVDAGHDFHSAWADINRAYAVLRPGGVLFGHDYFTVADDRGVRRAVNLFAKVKRLVVRPNGEHWVLEPKPSEDN